MKISIRPHYPSIVDWCLRGLRDPACKPRSRKVLEDMIREIAAYAEECAAAEDAAREKETK